MSIQKAHLILPILSLVCLVCFVVKYKTKPILLWTLSSPLWSIYKTNPIPLIFSPTTENAQKTKPIFSQDSRLVIIVFLQNKANFNVAHASVLESKSASAPGGFLNFAFCLLIFDITLPNEANLISQFSILNSQFRSPRLRNEPIYPVYPVNPVKKRNEANLKAGSWPPAAFSPNEPKF